MDNDEIEKYEHKEVEEIDASRQQKKDSHENLVQNTKREIKVKCEAGR
jgi:hypothetical protein